MLVCLNLNCQCINHLQLMQCIAEGANDEAILIQQELQKVHGVADRSCKILYLLHFAVTCGNIIMVQYFIDMNYIIDAIDSYGFTPLMLAVKQSNLEIIELLLKNNANIYTTDLQGKNSLQIGIANFCNLVASFEKSKRFLTMLFDKLSMDFLLNENKIGQWLLKIHDFVKLSAVALCNVDVTRFMLKNGYIVNFQIEAHGYTALHWAMMFEKVENAKVLIEYGAKVDVLDYRGFSPLYYYPQNCERVDKQSEVLKKLLNRKVKSYWPHKVQSTLLNLFGPVNTQITDMDWLLAMGNKETIKTALQSSNNFMDCLFNRKHFLHQLIENDDDGVLDAVDEIGINFDVNARRGDETPLMQAAYEGSVKKVEWLLKHGADVNLLDYDKQLALCHAMMDVRRSKIQVQNFTEIVEILLQCGTNVQLVFGSDIFDHVLYPENHLSINAVIAHFALLQTLNKSGLTKQTRDKIESKYMLLFNLYMQQLKEMKITVIREKITLFTILTEKEEKLVPYSRNKELILAFEAKMKEMNHLTPYYINTLNKRMENAKNKVEFLEKVGFAIETLTGLCSDVHLLTVQKIMNYLEYKDLNNLCKLESISIE